MHSYLYCSTLGNQTALIEKIPTNQLVRKGGTIFFDCVYENADFVEWYFKDNGPLETSNKYIQHNHRGVLF